MKLLQRLRALYWLPVFLYAAFLFYLSSLSHPPVPAHISDKLLHLGFYAGFGFLAARACRSILKKTDWWKILGLTLLLSLLYGASDEIHQYFVPPRTPEFLDLIMDGLGGLIGGWMYSLKDRIRQRAVLRTPS